MRILPVMDVKNGQVVHAVGGRRQEYRPIRSRLTSSSHPPEMAQAFRQHYSLTELYLADLDAIGGNSPAWHLYADLRALGFRLCVDAGVRDAWDATRMAAAGVEEIVVGLETISGPEDLADVCQQVGAHPIVFSLDLKNGKPLGNLLAWKWANPWAIAEQVVALGIRRLLVLDLAQVGGKGGTGTEALCFGLVKAFPKIEVLAGGGIRDLDDLRRLRQGGVQGILVASVLHDGRLQAEDLRSL